MMSQVAASRFLWTSTRSCTKQLCRRKVIDNLGFTGQKTYAATALSKNCCRERISLHLSKHSAFRKLPNCNNVSCSRNFSFNESGTSTTLQHDSPDSRFGADRLIEAWFNEVKTFGTLSLRDVPFDVIIQPLNPVDYPDGNKGIVKLFYNGDDNTGDGAEGEKSADDKQRIRASDTKLWKLSELGRACDLQVGVSEEGEMLEVVSAVPPGVQLPLTCLIHVPLKFDIEVVGSRFGTVTISKLESENCIVNMETGNCNLTDMKTATTSVNCVDGNISCHKQLLGSIMLRCENQGSITGDRLQGTNVMCTTQGGSINVKSIYAVESFCGSQSGAVTIRDCHGETMVTSAEGNLTVGSLDGKLRVRLDSGSADVYFSRHDGADIATKTGDVTLRFPEDTSSSLDLKASKIIRDNTLKVDLDQQGQGVLNGKPGAAVKASAVNGVISLKAQDWFSAMKLSTGK